MHVKWLWKWTKLRGKLLNQTARCYRTRQERKKVFEACGKKKKTASKPVSNRRKPQSACAMTSFTPFRPLTTSGSVCFSNRAPLIWNFLPQPIRTCTSYTSFKSHFLDLILKSRNILALALYDTYTLNSEPKALTGDKSEGIKSRGAAEAFIRGFSPVKAEGEEFNVLILSYTRELSRPFKENKG